MSESLKPDNPKEIAEENKNLTEVAGQEVRIDRQPSKRKPASRRSNGHKKNG